MAHHHKKIIDVISAIILLALFALDLMMWRTIFTARNSVAPHVYSLPLTHATSTLLVLPGGATVLTDAGSDATIVDDLQKTLPSGAATYIDLAIIPAPEVSDYEGYQYVLQHYSVGAFLYNGRSDDSHSAEWTQFANMIEAKHIPLITVGAGDRIRFGSGGEIDITAPDEAHAHSPDASDTTIFLLYNKQ